MIGGVNRPTVQFWRLPCVYATERDARAIGMSTAIFVWPRRPVVTGQCNALLCIFYTLCLSMSIRPRQYLLCLIVLDMCRLCRHCCNFFCCRQNLSLSHLCVYLYLSTTLTWVSLVYKIVQCHKLVKYLHEPPISFYSSYTNITKKKKTPMQKKKIWYTH